jgi:threonyl-tRNA synthetase
VPQTALDVLGSDRSVVAARINGEVRDLATEISDSDDVQPITVDSDEGLAILRHSSAHVAAQAVQKLFPEAKLGIGPPIKDGFYYEFDVPSRSRPRT